MKNKEMYLLVGVALIVGVLVGILVSKGKQGTPAPQIASPQAPAVNSQQQIQMLQGLVKSEPGNRNAWVELGNNYFDANQPMQAVEAYAKALELNPNDPNVLTDQGVMFRQLGWFDKAIDNFNRAGKLDPNHLQSLYNLGIVYRYDLNDFPKAVQAWKRYLQLAPPGPAAEKLRGEVEMMEQHPPLPGGTLPGMTPKQP